MGITEQDLLPLKKIKIPPEYENDSQFYQETIMKQYEKRRQRLLIEYNDLLNKKSEETQIHPKSQPPEEKYEDSTTSRINDKLLKMKKFQQDYREQQLMQYSQKEQLIETRRKQINSERELRAQQKEVLDTSRLEQVQRNRNMIEKFITDKHVRRRMSYDAKLQKWELHKQAQYLIPRSSRMDETLARYQRSQEEKKQQDLQRLRRLEESLEKACSKKTQNIIEIKRRGLLEQLKIEEALFNRQRSQNSKNSNILEKVQQKTVFIRPSMSEIPKQKPFPQPKFLCSKQQKKLNSQTISHFSQEIISLVDSINIHDIEEKLLQVFATQDKTQRELFAKTNYLFLYH
ncbi:unnamed protein product [Paramecium primaurelia]|uniref:Uncharacterized protein n=2 Tax=Paramecium TaxID=5884 RepID=A0A8S1T2F0_9CILI|nr:unnamed protein product [Paramecium primaurelia]CAD8145848.1 unnamed protein product [Paramecium pentaurelia]